MNHYVIYANDGSILSSASGTQAPVVPEYQVLQVENIPPDLRLYYVVNSALVAYTPEQAQLRANKPRPRAKWSNATMAWLDDRTLEQARSDKRAQIDAWRLEANSSGFIYQNKRVATDTLSMLDITNTGLRIAATQAMPPDWPGGWKAEGSFIPITTVADWNAFFDAMYQQGLANFMRSQVLKAMVDNPLATIAEIDAITWSTVI